MTELQLSNCVLRPLSTFKGFRSLKKLVFISVTLAQHVLENLLCCPLLENLDMTYCHGFNHLKIDAPNLRFLSFVGSLADVSLQNTLNLVVVCFHLTGTHYRPACASSSNLAKFFVDLPHIQRLTIDGFAAQYLAVGDLPGRLPKPCLDLNFLRLLVYYNDLAEILTTLYLLKSSPALEVLHVTVHQEEEEEEDVAVDEEANSWLDNLDDDRNCSFPKLRLVEITNFTGCKAELDFIRFLLLNSPALETMTIRASSTVASSKVLKNLLQLRRVSSVVIIYLDLVL